MKQSATKPIARGSRTRTENMNKRRAQILERASNIIATKGLEGFTLGVLATEASVTVPTIHNLIGKKSDIGLAEPNSYLASKILINLSRLWKILSPD